MRVLAMVAFEREGTRSIEDVFLLCCKKVLVEKNCTSAHCLELLAASLPEGRRRPIFASLQKFSVEFPSGNVENSGINLKGHTAEGISIEVYMTRFRKEEVCACVKLVPMPIVCRCVISDDFL